MDESKTQEDTNRALLIEILARLSAQEYLLEIAYLNLFQSSNDEFARFKDAVIAKGRDGDVSSDQDPLDLAVRQASQARLENFFEKVARRREKYHR